MADSEQLVFCIPWGHNRTIIDKCRDNPAKALFFVKETTLGNNYVRICCFLYIIANALTYFMNSRAVLYEAEQRTYKTSNLNHLLLIVKGIVEIILAICGCDLMTIIISFLITTF